MTTLSINCAQEFSSDTYFSCGPTQVVTTAAGTYRQAQAAPLGRFGYRFHIEHPGQPHELILRYPDDRRRFMLIGDGTTYDLSTGIITGHAYPISGQMQELRQVFWPRFSDCSICFMTWGYDEPAAVSSFEIRELTALPPETIPSKPGCRELGIQYEDPCGTGASEGSQTFSQWLDHVVEFAHHTGQNSLSYPICWYHGPLFPMDHERSDVFSMVVADDRKQYIAWTDSPPDWPAALLERFDREGLRFQGVFTLLRLSSLMRRMNIDLDAIKAGAPTLNNMLWNNQVQAGTMDWTVLYNSINYDGVLKRTNPIALTPDFKWAYGERVDHTYKPDALYRPGPLFNPLHPEVQAAVIDLFAKTAQRYARFKSFTGVAVTMWAPTLLWFGSLHSGYDDFTCDLFERQTGIHIPVKPDDPERFAKRYDFLVFQCPSAWIQWRCERIAEFIRKIRDAMVQVRPDLQFTLNLWSEPFLPAVLGSGLAQHQTGARPSTLDLYRQAGLDPDLLADEPNITCDLQIDGGGRDRSPSNIKDSPIESYFMHRDHAFLDQPTLDAERRQQQPGVFIFNAWHEAWGTHRWFPCESGDKNPATIGETYNQKTPHVFRINSEYPADGFWWDSQLRISPAFPPAPYFMEPYAHALAECDALRITRGGLFLDKAHIDEVREFARAYRALPAEKFDTWPSVTDPVMLRHKRIGEKQYVYLVNRIAEPLSVRIECANKPATLIDMATGQSIPCGASVEIQLNGFGLRAFETSELHMSSVHVMIPDALWRQTQQDADRAVQAIAAAAAAGRHIAGMSMLAAQIRQAIQCRHIAWLRHALSSYIVRKVLA